MTFSLSTHCNSKEHQSLSGRLSPSGRFSFAQIFPKKKKRLNDEKVQDPDKGPLRSLQQIDEAYSNILGGGLPSLPGVLQSQPECDATIGLSTAPISDKRKKRGSKGPSARSRDIISWAANQLEFAHSKQNMSFLTLTLPEMSDGQLGVVQGNWSAIVNQVVKEIRRRLKNEGVPTHVVGCTEIQTERELRTGQRYPHLHLVFRGRRHSQTGWALSPRQYRGIWRTVVLRFLGNVQFDWSASENVQPIKKSTGGYLAKYLSKSGSKSAGRDRDAWHPSDWGIVSRALRSLYARLSYSGYEVGAFLSSLGAQWLDEFGWIRPIFIATRGYGKRRIGFYGWLKGEARYVSAMELFALI